MRPDVRDGDPKIYMGENSEQQSGWKMRIEAAFV